MAHDPIGLEGFDNILVEDSRRKGINLEGLALLPEGGGWLVVEFGADNIGGSGSQSRVPDGSARAAAAPPDMRLFTDPREAKPVWDVRESGLGVTSHVPGEPLTLGRLGGLRRRARKTWRLPARSAQAHAGLSLRGLVLRPFRSRLRAHPHRFRSANRRGIAKFRQFMEEAADLVVRYGGSLSGEHGDGQVARRTAAQDVRPGNDAGLPRIQVHLGSRLADESRASSSSRTASMKICASAPTTIPGSRRRISSFPTITAASQTRPCAAWASASAAATKAASCVPATASRAKRSTRPAAAPTCSGK